MTGRNRKIVIAVAAIVAAYVAYKYFTGGSSASSTGVPNAADQASADYAAQAGQEQSDVAGLQGQVDTLTGQEQSDVATLQGQEQSDWATLTGGVQGLGAQIAALPPNVTRTVIGKSPFTKRELKRLNELAMGHRKPNRHANHKTKTAGRQRHAAQHHQANKGRQQRAAAPHTNASPNPHIAPAHHGPKPSHGSRGRHRGR